jgi:flagellar motor protein MotB
VKIGTRRQTASVDEENPYWVSFSDILSALLIIFILAAVILILQLMERQNTFDDEVKLLQKAEQVRDSILAEAREELERRGIRVEINRNDAVLRIPNDLLGFDTGAFELLPRYQNTAREIGEVLNQVITKDDRIKYLDTVFIEGHTDARPFQGFMGKGNWGLSTFRAISLWQFWSSALPEGEQLDRLVNESHQPLFSVSGYAETRPVSTGSMEDDYTRNRRVDIRFTIRRPGVKDYEGVRDSLGGGT